VGLLRDNDLCAVAYLGGDAGRGVQRSAQTVVSGGQPKVLCVVRPTVRDVVLAAAVHLVRAVRKLGAAIVKPGALVAFVGLNEVSTRQVAQTLLIRSESGGQRIEGALLAT